MRFSHLGFAAVQALAVSASRLPVSGSDCRLVASVISEFSHLGAVATEFCYSYLDIPATTTYFATGTETPTSLASVTLPAQTVTITSSACPVTTTPVAVDKRHIPAPSGLEQYAASVLSSACSRLSLAPTASTTSTDIVSIATTSTVDVPGATETVCISCTPIGGSCDITNPGKCCSLTCNCYNQPCACVAFPY